MSLQQKKTLPVWLLLILGILISLFAADHVRRNLNKDESLRIAYAADQIKLKLRERLLAHELSLRGAAGLFTTYDNVSRGQWKTYFELLQIDETVPGTQGIGFAELIQPAQLETHILRIRREGFPKYDVTPPGKRELYSAIIYLEPFRDRNLRAFGYDMYSEPVRRAAMEQARDTGKAALSGAVQLVQESGKETQVGILMYMPVYRQGMAVDTVEQRQSALIGWAYSPFRMNDLITNALGQWKDQLGSEFNISVFEVTEQSLATPLFSVSDKSSAHTDHLPLEQRIIEFNGRQWMLIVDHPHGNYAVAYTAAWLTLIGGLLLSIVLAALAWSLINTRAHAISIAETLTVEIKQREQQLIDSEYRWKFSLEGSDLGVWDWDIPGEKVFFSKRWKGMLGHAEHEIGNSLKEWSERVHPDDLAEIMAQIQAYFEGKLPVYQLEHRLRCKDGSYKWILARGMVVKWGEDGKPLRMIGTHTDITDRKTSQIQLQAAFDDSKRLHEALDHVPAYIYMKDTNSRYVYANKLTLDLLGVSAEELAGSRDDRFFPAETVKQLQEIDQRVLAGKHSSEEIDIAISGQPLRTFLEAKTPIYADDERTSLWGLCGISIDITGIKELTNKLQDRQSVLEEAERIAHLGSWQLELASGQITWSKELSRIYGLDPENPPPNLDQHRKLLTDESWERLNLALAQTQDDGLPYEIELEIIRVDGEHRWILARGEAKRGADGMASSIHGTALDITEQKRANQALIDSQTLLHSVVENAPARIFWKDIELRYLGCNKAFAHDAGMSDPEDLLGKDDFELSWREQAELYRADDRQVIDSGIPRLGFEEPQTTTDGHKIWLRTSKVPLRDQSGKIFGLLGVYEDITESKQYELNILRLTKLYAALSECNAAVIHCTNESELLKRLCEVVVDLSGVAMAWVGLTKPSGQIIPVASHGSNLEYLDNINVTIDANESHGRGPTGTAVRENRAIWIDDFKTSSITTPWKHRGSPYGWLSSAALPICRSGQPVGALSLYSKETGGWHNEQTRDLLEKMVSAISFALDKFVAAESARSSQATLADSEERFRTMVEQSIAGTFIIQHDTLIYVNPRLEQILGYPVGDGLTGQPPLSIVADKDRNMAAQQLRRLLDNDAQNTSFTFSAVRRDGSITEVGVSLARAQYQQLPALIGLMQDISDRKVAEEQISRYAKQLEQAFMQMVTLATTLSEMRDAYTAGHEKRVAEIAVAIGAEMGLDPERLEGLKVGGYLHDVGKVSIPSEILAKPGRLSPIEYELIKSHAQAGYDVLKSIEFPWPVAQIAHQHHERIDGSGYPRGLKGDQIILEARIVAIADVVESMGSHRPYRAALGIDKALAEIERGAGSLYDPVIAAVCLRLFREKHYQLPA